MYVLLAASWSSAFAQSAGQSGAVWTGAGAGAVAGARVAARPPLSDWDFKYTYLLGESVSFENLSGRRCTYYDASALKKIDYSSFKGFSRPKPGTYCDPVLLDVGCGHCGTNSMSNYFNSHPNMSIAPTKPMGFASTVFTKKHGRPLYETVFAPQQANGHGPFGVDISEDIIGGLSAGTRSPAQINKNLPNIKILVHLRNPIDKDMSKAYMTDAETYHQKFTRDLKSGAFRKRWPRMCFVDGLEKLLRVTGPGRILALETQRLFWHRDEAFAEILKFAGLPPFDLNLPKVVDCKSKRYKGTFAGCYSGASRVAPKTHKIFDARVAVSFLCPRRARERASPDVEPSTGFHTCASAARGSSSSSATRRSSTTPLPRRSPGPRATTERTRTKRGNASSAHGHPTYPSYLPSSNKT